MCHQIDCMYFDDGYQVFEYFNVKELNRNVCENINQKVDGIMDFLRIYVDG